ncbi:MAG: nucleoside recognition domain-containing protein [Rubrobacteraceae bacterium]
MEISANAFQSVVVGIFQLALIVFPVMVMIQVLKDLGPLGRFAAGMRPLMGLLGIAPRGAVTMAGGLVFGLAFGAGVIMEQVREQKFTKREITLMILFLCACHAVIEDTLIFIPLGVDVLPLLIIRLLAAGALTVLVARLWRET